MTDAPRRNLEIKARHADLPAARAVAQALCGAPTLEHQTDTYFVVPHGRLKLREINDQPATLIAYARADAAATRLSHYHLVPVAEPRLLEAALAATLGVRGRVRKQREIFLYRNVRIHLDEVEGLGSFLELEAVLEATDSPASAQPLLDDLLARLHVPAGNFLAVSYADLLGF